MPRGRVIVSIHDVSPAWETQIEAAMTALAKWKLAPPALLVVPDFHGRHCLTAFPRFVDRLRAWQKGGSELILHGYTHADPEGAPPARGWTWLESKLLTANEGEFHRLDFEATRERLGRGLEMFQQLFGTRPAGFVAPAWLTNPLSRRAIAAAGFRFTEDHWFVDDLATGERHLAPAVTFSGRTLPRAIASAGFASSMRIAVRAPFDLRFALHPKDFDSRLLVAAIGRLARDIAATRQRASYAELLG
jgi:uncharacterized protein